MKLEAWFVAPSQPGVAPGVGTPICGCHILRSVPFKDAEV